jgi:agmatine/peptidylarginine deiminase
MAFENAGLKTEVLPCTAYGTDKSKNKNGLYINFLKLDNLIVMPSFNQDEDKKAARKLQDLYFRKVIQINAEMLAEEGGLINCVTWSY